MAEGLIVDCAEYAKELRRPPNRQDFDRTVTTWELTADELDDRERQAQGDRNADVAAAERHTRRVEALQTAAEAVGLTPAAYAELHGLDGLDG